MWFPFLNRTRKRWYTFQKNDELPFGSGGGGCGAVADHHTSTALFVNPREPKSAGRLLQDSREETAMGQNQRYHVGIGALPISVVWYNSGFAFSTICD